MFSTVAAIFISMGFLLVNLENERFSIYLLLPGNNELNGWFMQDNVKYFTGNEVSVYFPSMVHIFSEYGLKKFITASYTNAGNQIITTEIYQMTDHGGAYGLFSVSRKSGVKKAGYGDESYQNDKCVYFWKGNYYVKVHADIKSKKAREGILQIVSAIDKKIDDEGRRPAIIELLPEESFVTEGTRYFRGSAGLSSELPFGYDDISGFSEGVYGDFGTYRLIILKYESPEDRKTWLEKITCNLPNNKRYHKISDNDDDHRFGDKEGNNIVFGSVGIFIMVYIGQDVTRQPEIFEKIEDAMFYSYPKVPGCR